MATLATVFTLPATDDFDPQPYIEWAEREGLDPMRILTAGFRIDRRDDGELICRYREVVLDDYGMDVLAYVDGEPVSKSIARAQIVETTPVLREDHSGHGCLADRRISVMDAGGGK